MIRIPQLFYDEKAKIEKIKNNVDKCIDKIHSIKESIELENQKQFDEIEIFIMSDEINFFNSNEEIRNKKIMGLEHTLTKLDKYQKELLMKITVIKQKQFEFLNKCKFLNTKYYDKILRNLCVPYGKIFKLHYKIEQITNIDISVTPIIELNYSSKSNIFYYGENHSIKNGECLNITRNAFSKKQNYFFKALKVNILMLMDIGGSEADLITEKKKVDIIDIDIYENIEKTTFCKIINTVYCNEETDEMYNTIHFIVNSLSLLIFGTHAVYTGSHTFSHITYCDSNRRCIDMRFQVDGISISIDINRDLPARYCNSNSTNTNIDFLCNAFRISLKKNTILIQSISHNEWTQKSVSKFAHYGKQYENIFKIGLIKKIINEMLDDTTKAFYMTANKITLYTHNLCTDDTRCTCGDKCKQCTNIALNMICRTYKMGNKKDWDIIREPCDKRYCIVNKMKDYWDGNIEVVKKIERIEVTKFTYHNYMHFPVAFEDNQRVYG